jgi:predicted MPP superfamily phosphohydrolase
VPNTWPAFNILHLSDLHLRRSDLSLFKAQKAALCRVERQPDLVCVTGDLCERESHAPLVAELLQLLAPRFGMYVILGNHEYGASSPVRRQRPEAQVAGLLKKLYGPALSSGIKEGEAIGVALEQLGLRVLRNEGVRLQIDAHSLWLSGVDDGWAGRADVKAAMRGRRPDEAVLTLIHEPELAFAAVDEGADVVLAGHTHGGQVCLPQFGAVYWHRLDSRLTKAAGVQTIGQAQLHVSAGTGQVLPLRFRCPPELVWLECVPAEGQDLATGEVRSAREAQLPAIGIA